jgi:hypothetical protein
MFFNLESRFRISTTLSAVWMGSGFTRIIEACLTSTLLAPITSLIDCCCFDVDFRLRTITRGGSIQLVWPWGPPAAAQSRRQFRDSRHRVHDSSTHKLRQLPLPTVNIKAASSIHKLKVSVFLSIFKRANCSIRRWTLPRSIKWCLRAAKRWAEKRMHSFTAITLWPADPSHQTLITQIRWAQRPERRS